MRHRAEFPRNESTRDLVAKLRSEPRSEDLRVMQTRGMIAGIETGRASNPLRPRSTRQHSPFSMPRVSGRPYSIQENRESVDSGALLQSQKPLLRTEHLEIRA